MKLYIVGSVASGKTTLARSLSNQTGIPYYSLDEVVHEKDNTKPMGNRKRTPEERDALFAEILAQPSYIIEDTGRECFEDGIRQADKIILLDIPLMKRQYRILKRHLKQKLGIEKCIYRPQWKMLKYMLKWAKNFESGEDGVRKRVMKYGNKVVVLKSNKDIKCYLEDSK